MTVPIRPSGSRLCLTRPMRLTFVEEVEGGVHQVGEDRRGFLAEIFEVAGHVLVHREAADLLHMLVLPQKVSLHRHRHAAAAVDSEPQSSDTGSRTETQTQNRHLNSPRKIPVCDAAINFSLFYVYFRR